MDPEILKKLEEHDRKLQEIFESVEKTRKYFLWTMIIAVAAVVVPLIGLAIMIPQFLSVYSGLGTGGL